MLQLLQLSQHQSPLQRLLNQQLQSQHQSLQQRPLSRRQLQSQLQNQQQLISQHQNLQLTSQLRLQNPHPNLLIGQRTTIMFTLHTQHTDLGTQHTLHMLQDILLTILDHRHMLIGIQLINQQLLSQRLTNQQLLSQQLQPLNQQLHRQQVCWYLLYNLYQYA